MVGVSQTSGFIAWPFRRAAPVRTLPSPSAMRHDENGKSIWLVAAVRTLPFPSPRPSPLGRGRADAGLSRRGHASAREPPRGLPLPKGEGRGEGKGTVQSLKRVLLLADVQTFGTNGSVHFFAAQPPSFLRRPCAVPGGQDGLHNA